MSNIPPYDPLNQPGGVYQPPGGTGRVYQHSGAVPIVGGLITIFAGGISAILGAIVYVLAFEMIPFIYINILFTFLFGVVIGCSVGGAAMVGKIRNNLLVGIFLFVFSLLGLYVEWGASMWAKGLAPNLSMSLFRPDVIWNYAGALYQNGSWGLAADNITGIFLVLFWVVEAGIVIVTAWGCGSAFTSDQPFCERCDEWTTTEDGMVNLKATGTEPAWSRIVTGDLQGLNEFTHIDGSESTMVGLDLASCMTCGENHFLTINKVTYTTDSDGDVTEEKTALVKNLILEPNQVELVRNCGMPNPANQAGEDIADAMRDADYES